MTATATNTTDKLAELRPAWGVAIIATASVLAHAWMLIIHEHGVTLTVLMVGMTLWCSWCAVEAVVQPTRHCLQRLAFMSLAMVAVHVPMIFSMWADSSSAGHPHHTEMAATTTAVNTHIGAMLAIIGLELMVTLVCWLRLRRR